ncbi:hypothetical protein [uncultured Ferrimonas sp.]|uniref:hypothetical protein n=1 Tax=uncultured Ferrimonas sp. TaxID=432640 RepID=UPI002627E0B7|nr:hypothetical protein [uncultured Ferrimonas sp.]
MNHFPIPQTIAPTIAPRNWAHSGYRAGAWPQRAFAGALLLLALLSASVSANNQCPADQLIASYRLTQQQHGQAPQVTTLQLVRHGNRVAMADIGAQHSQSWTKLSNQRLISSRHYDDHQRSIDYASSELRQRGGNSQWQQHYQLVPPALFSQLTLQPQPQQPQQLSQECAALRHYRGQQDQRHVTLHWLNQLQLPQYWQVQAPHSQWQLQLIGIDHQPQAIDAFFAQRDQYQAVDFADIGDNEQDPFLRQMISLGFKPLQGITAH